MKKGDRVRLIDGREGAVEWTYKLPAGAIFAGSIHCVIRLDDREQLAHVALHTLTLTAHQRDEER